MNNQKPPRCPRCDGKGIPTPGGLFKCSKCGGLYDDDFSEGGDYYDDPTKRIEKQEYKASRKNNDRPHGNVRRPR